MKIEKLPSGSYRIRKNYKGKTYTIITEYKLSQKEAMLMMAKKLEEADAAPARMTFEMAANEYLEIKSQVLSPTTLVGYAGYLRSISNTFKAKHIVDITQIDVQKEINSYSKGRSAKTVRNVHGFISAVLRTYKPNLVLNTTLPKKMPVEVYIPSDEDVRRILERAKGTTMEIPLSLSCYGLRRSELCALQIEDLNGNEITISKSKVFTSDHEWIIRPITKTEGSYRKIYIPDSLADKIREQGYIYNGSPSTLIRNLNRYQEELGIPKFPLHKLRHYFASKMSTITDEATVMALGGWKTDHVMKNVYRHSMAEKEKKKEIANAFANDIFS